MSKPRVLSAAGVWIVVWPAYGFAPEPCMTPYDSWGEAIAAAGRGFDVGAGAMIAHGEPRYEPGALVWV